MWSYPQTRKHIQTDKDTYADRQWHICRDTKTHMQTDKDAYADRQRHTYADRQTETGRDVLQGFCWCVGAGDATSVDGGEPAGQRQVLRLRQDLRQHPTPLRLAMPVVPRHGTSSTLINYSCSSIIHADRSVMRIDHSCGSIIHADRSYYSCKWFICISLQLLWLVYSFIIHFSLVFNCSH